MSDTLIRILAGFFLFSFIGCTSQTPTLSNTDILTACERLVAFYPVPRDSLDGSTYGNMFTSDGEFILRGATTKGREKIVDQFLARASQNTTRHVTGSINISKLDETSATGISYAMVFQSQAVDKGKPHALDTKTLLAVVSYEDKFSFDGERCFFTQRKVNIDFLNSQNNNEQ